MVVGVRIKSEMILVLEMRNKEYEKQKAHHEVLAMGTLGTPSIMAQACAPLLRSKNTATDSKVRQLFKSKYK